MPTTKAQAAKPQLKERPKRQRGKALMGLEEASSCGGIFRGLCFIGLDHVLLACVLH